MLDIETTQQKLLGTITPNLVAENISLNDSLDRILAEDIVSKIFVPPEDNSAMDGYAVHSRSLESSKTTLQISQRIPAGIYPAPLAEGTAARIFTGAIIPENADTVIMQENCEQSGNSVTILEKAKAKQNIRPKGQDIKVGHHIALNGEKITPQLIGLIASIGEQRISVYKKIRVAIVSTGDELVEVGQTLKPGQIYNSNRAMLHALLTKLSCEVWSTSIVSDDLDTTCKSLEECAKNSDIVISTGGVSVGEEDHVKNAVSMLGELDLWKVKIKPGKPLAFGNVRGTPFIGLPGNPVSAFVTFVLFAIPLINRLQGRNSTKPQSFFLPAKFERKTLQSRPEFIRVQIIERGIAAYQNQSSGVLTSICWADALALIPENTAIKTGDLVEVFPLCLLFS